MTSPKGRTDIAGQIKSKDSSHVGSVAAENSKIFVDISREFDAEQSIVFGQHMTVKQDAPSDGTA